MREGKIRSEILETYYGVFGDPTNPPAGRLPILALHGGPGLPHESLEPLEALARGSRPVVFYDQIGCGNSTRTHAPAWGVDLFLRELAAVRRELGLSRVHLLGHSWGGMLAMEHALTGANGLASLVLVGAIASGETMLENRKSFFERLPETERAAIRRHEAAGTFDSPEYAEAMDIFHRRFTCRLDPWPDWLNRALARMDIEANAAMWGPPNAPGPLRAWDLRPRLGEIGVPTLVVAGRHDGMAAGQEDDLHAGIPGSELVVFEESSHYPFAEEPERFVAVVEGFLARCEGHNRPPTQ